MTKKRIPKIMTLDTETIDLDGALKRIALYDGDKIYYGYTFGDIAWRIEQYYDMGFMPHIYIHNFDFDARKLPEIWERGNVVWSRTKKIGTKYAKVVCKHYVLHDSLKLLPFALAKLSKDFGLTHGKVNLFDEVQKLYPGQYVDNVDFLNRCDPDNPLYLEYLGYDVLSLYELLEKLIEVSGIPAENLVGCLSTASMSKYLFKNGYKGQTFGNPENTDFEILTSCKAWGSKKTMQQSSVSYEEIEYKMREGFYGGRTEVFIPLMKEQSDPFGNRRVVGWHYDVNSLYPAAMALLQQLSGIDIGLEFPVGYPEYEHDQLLIKRHWEEWLRKHNGLGFIKATVYIPPQDIPPLPAKMGKLVFVTGFVKGTWTYPELEYAVKNCGVEIVEFHEQIHFKKTHPIFSNFVRCFYELKEQGKREGNASLTAFAKLILNTAYGWTVLRRDDKTAFRDISMLDKWKDTDKFIIANEELGYIEIFDTVHATSIQVQVGAYVTSYARLILLDALRKAADRGHVYYCDTDSIVCDKPFPPELVDSYALGKWDLEKRLYSALFIQPKVYTEEVVKESPKDKDTIKFKGVSRARQAELTREIYEDIYENIVTGKQSKYLIETGRKTLPSLSVAQKNHIDPNTFKITDKEINLKAKGKRNFDYAGNRSTAWHMNSLDEFENFSFANFVNPPDGKNVFGG